MLKAYLHSKLMFSKPYILKADLYSKMEFSKPYIWFTEYMVYRTLLYKKQLIEELIGSTQPKIDELRKHLCALTLKNYENY